MTPAVVIRPILLRGDSVNQRLPSGPAVMPEGSLSAVGIGNSVTTPAGVMRPILLAAFGEPEVAVGPAVMPRGGCGRRDRELGDDLTTRDAGQRPYPRRARSGAAERPRARSARPWPLRDSEKRAETSAETGPGVAS